jgi:hypothetical protein
MTAGNGHIARPFPPLPAHRERGLGGEGVPGQGVRVFSRDYKSAVGCPSSSA